MPLVHGSQGRPMPVQNANHEAQDSSKERAIFPRDNHRDQ